MALIRQVTADIGTRRVDALRIDFRAHHTDGSSPNKLSLSIYNPGATLISQARDGNAAVRVRAGYRDENIGLVFQGNVIPASVDVKRMGGHSILTLDAGDGWAAMANGYVNLSYPAPVTIQNIVADISALAGKATDADEVLKVAERFSGTDFIDKAFVIHNRGVSYSGSIRDVMDALTGAAGLKWTYQDNVLTVYDPVTGWGEAPISGPLFSSAKGTIMGLPTKKKNDSVTVRGLMRPGMRPGRPFRVDSRDITGNYLANDVIHAGSNWEGDYYTECTGAPY